MSTAPVPHRRPAEAALDRFQTVLHRPAASTRADDELLSALRDIDATGATAGALAALRRLADRPHRAMRLDEHLRQQQRQAFRQEPAPVRWHGVPAVDAGPIAVALACSHSDGRVRERAVRRILEQPSPELLPFVVLRTGDWVRQVRDVARAGLAAVLDEDPVRYLPSAAPMAVWAERRRHGGFAHRQVIAALLSAPATTVAELLADPSREVRRLVLDSTAATHRLTAGMLVRLAESDPDVRIRSRAAEWAARDALWTSRLDLLRRLAESRHREVRVTALTGLIRAGHAEEAVTFLDDPAALVRAVARDAARRTGTDPLAHYRTAIRTGRPPTGAIAGLAETGRSSDSALLVPLLDHPNPAVRAHTVRGLRTLDAVPLDRVIPLLRDASTKVIREATTALLPSASQLSPELAPALLADPDRAAVRRAGYRLLRTCDLASRLRLALSVATDPDARLSGRAAADAAALTRRLHPSPWRTRPLPPFSPTAEQQAELLALARTAAPVLPRRTVQLLHEHFVPTSCATELLRVRYGPHPDTTNPLIGIRAAFTAQDPRATLNLIREVLLIVLKHSTAPAEDWPADEQWPAVLPEWFVQRCAPEPPRRQGDPGSRLARWHSLTHEQRQLEALIQAEADWTLSGWLDVFHPDSVEDERSWRYWDSGVDSLTAGWISVGVDGHPYGGGQQLIWLIEAAGGYNIDLP